MTQPGMTVSELNSLISSTLRREPQLRDVTVTAEVSGFKHYLTSGHWYFSLKDESASISCVMFRQNTFYASLKPKDGDRVTVAGYVEIYARDGRMQLYVTAMKKAGQGSLYEQFEALKKKLEAEGLFDPARKRLLPQIPRKVAVITSANGAALHDILNVSGMRSPAIPIVLIPSTVQGTGAAAELAAALRKVSLIPQVDAVIIARGGGSAEDLWCFNEEIVARAVVECPVPVVSGVGHETDFTICDFSADVRASTPSNAAEIVFPDRMELRGRTRLLRTSLSRAVNDQTHAALLTVYAMKERLQRSSPDRVIHTLEARAVQSRTRLANVMAFHLRAREEELLRSRTALCLQLERRIRECEFEIRRLRTRLDAISPMRVLERGYALVYNEKGGVLPDRRSAEEADRLQIRFRDGMIGPLRKEQ